MRKAWIPPSALHAPPAEGPEARLVRDGARLPFRLAEVFACLLLVAGLGAAAGTAALCLLVFDPDGAGIPPGFGWPRGVVPFGFAVGFVIGFVAVPALREADRS
jgi:hypothetical protein